MIWRNSSSYVHMPPHAQSWPYYLSCIAFLFIEFLSNAYKVFQQKRSQKLSKELLPYFIWKNNSAYSVAPFDHLSSYHNTSCCLFYSRSTQCIWTSTCKFFSFQTIVLTTKLKKILSSSMDLSFCYWSPRLYTQENILKRKDTKIWKSLDTTVINAAILLENGCSTRELPDNRVKLTGFSLWDTRFETSFVFKEKKVLKTPFHLPLQKPTLEKRGKEDLSDSQVPAQPRKETCATPPTAHFLKPSGFDFHKRFTPKCLIIKIFRYF